MLTAQDKKEMKDIIVEVIKDVVLPALQVLDEKMDKGFETLNEKIEAVDIKVDEIALNQKKDRQRITALEKVFTHS